MIALLLTLVLLPQEVSEQEPNGERAQAKQELRPGATLLGSLEPDGDRDWVLVVCEQDTVCSLRLEVADDASAHLELHLPRTTLTSLRGGGTLELLRVLIPKGRTAVCIAGRAPRYRCRLTVEAQGECFEVEPNDTAETAHLLVEGQSWRGNNSGSLNELDCYVFKTTTAGPRELVLKCGPRQERPFRGYIGVFGADPLKVDYYYYLNGFADEFHFYPVLEPGTWNVQLTIQADTPRAAPYELSIGPVGGKVTEAEVKAARAAIERAIAFLAKPDEAVLQQVSTAAESLVLAALSEGAGAKERRESLDRDYVARLEGRFQKVEGGEVFYVEQNIYTHAMATLGLAEAAANGSDKAKALAIRAAEFLVATQNTERKPQVWKGPVGKRAPGYGGWRYAPAEDQSDLSIVGWCLIGLTAVDAAGLEVAGLRDAIEAGLHYVKTTGDQEGFGYQQPKGGSNIHNSIGALLMLLYGEQTAALTFATRQLDKHLWAATQVDRGDGYPFYYLYYATRAQYLRSGEVWETWRATALRQLLRRQGADGSWAALSYENQPGPRWTTALGLMMLRLCLNEAPKYLRVEAKGF